MTKLQKYIKLINRSHEQTLKVADRIGVEPALKMIQDARESIMKKLYKLQSKSGRFTYTLMQQTKAQLDREYNQLRILLYKHGADSFPKIADETVERTADTLQAADKLFTGIVTPLQMTEASYMTYIAGKASGSVLRHYKSSIQRYGLETIEKIELHMSKSLLAKYDTMHVIHGIQDIIGGNEYKAERIVRTESAAAYGITEAVSIREAKRDLPDLKKRWSASPDACDCCASLDGEKIEVNQTFTCRSGKSSLDALHEPIHPNCKCSVAPWRSAWEK